MCVTRVLLVHIAGPMREVNSVHCTLFGAVLQVSLSGGQYELKCQMHDHIEAGFQCLSFVATATQGARGSV
jgi:hypothetical protein